MIDFIKPYLGENEDSFAKRKAYFLRNLKPRFDFCVLNLERKLQNAKPITVQEREEIDSFWSEFMTPHMMFCLIDYRYYDMYNNVRPEGLPIYQYIPDSFYQPFVDEYFTNPQHSRPCDDKNLYDLYFHDLKRPITVFRKIDGLLLDADYGALTLKQVVDKCRDCGEVVLKPAKFTAGGNGVRFWNADQDDVSIISEYLQNTQFVICQKIIKQHPELNRLSSNSVNSIRMMTMVFDNQTFLLSSVVRMGTNTARIDNFTSGGIASGVKSNGQLRNIAFDVCANKYYKHPLGTVFEQVVIPNYSECVEIVKMLAKRFSTLSRLISWDLAIDETGHPLLIEFNASWAGVDVHQLCNGPIFGDMTHDVMKEVFDKSYTLNSIIKSFQ